VFCAADTSRRDLPAGVLYQGRLRRRFCDRLRKFVTHLPRSPAPRPRPARKTRRSAIREAGEFVDPAQVRPRVGEDGSDYPSAISRSNWRGLAPPERQFDRASVADARTGEGEEEAFQEDRRPNGDDRQAGPRERLLARHFRLRLFPWAGVTQWRARLHRAG